VRFTSGLKSLTVPILPNPGQPTLVSPVFLSLPLRRWSVFFFYHPPFFASEIVSLLSVIHLKWMSRLPPPSNNDLPCCQDVYSNSAKVYYPDPLALVPPHLSVCLIKQCCLPSLDRSFRLHSPHPFSCCGRRPCLLIGKLFRAVHVVMCLLTLSVGFPDEMYVVCFVFCFSQPHRPSAPNSTTTPLPGSSLLEDLPLSVPLSNALRGIPLVRSGLRGPPKGISQASLPTAPPLASKMPPFLTSI